jgi:hypothetical protein
MGGSFLGPGFVPSDDATGVQARQAVSDDTTQMLAQVSKFDQFRQRPCSEALIEMTEQLTLQFLETIATDNRMQMKGMDKGYEDIVTTMIAEPLDSSELKILHNFSRACGKTLESLQSQLDIECVYAFDS